MQRRSFSPARFLRRLVPVLFVLAIAAAPARAQESVSGLGSVAVGLTFGTTLPFHSGTVGLTNFVGPLANWELVPNVGVSGGLVGRLMYRELWGIEARLLMESARASSTRHYASATQLDEGRSFEPMPDVPVDLTFRTVVTMITLEESYVASVASFGDGRLELCIGPVASLVLGMNVHGTMTADTPAFADSGLRTADDGRTQVLVDGDDPDMESALIGLTLGVDYHRPISANLEIVASARYRYSITELNRDGRRASFLVLTFGIAWTGL